MGIKLNSSWLASVTGIAKDLVSLLRDGAIFLLAVLLVVFPAKINSILSSAGFQEGSVAGFKWEHFKESNNQTLGETKVTIATLQEKYNEVYKALIDAKGKLNDAKLLKLIAKFEEDNDSLKINTKNVQAKVTETINANIALVEKGQTSKVKRYYIIAMTSADSEDVDAEIKRVKRKVGDSFDKDFPNIKVYAPQGNPLYTLLISGKSLPYEEASNLKERAIKANFSKDTWLWQSNVEYFDDLK
jgi:hypothetical protein